MYAIRVYRKSKKIERKNMRGKRRGGKNIYHNNNVLCKKARVGYILCFFLCPQSSKVFILRPKMVVKKNRELSIIIIFISI